MRHRGSKPLPIASAFHPVPILPPAGRAAIRGSVSWKRTACLLALMMVLGGCGRKAAIAYPEIQVREPDLSRGGEIFGEVLFAGKPPRRRRIDMTSDGICSQSGLGRPTLDESVVVTDGKVRDVLVHVKEGLGEYVFAHEKSEAVLDQHGCVYVPHVLALRVHQPLLVKNSDPTAHNVNTSDSRRGQGFNTSLPGRGATFRWQFREPELSLPMHCNIHPWMKGYIHVLDHPYFAVTGEDGRWRFPRKLPPGRYLLEALHPRLGTRRREVTVVEGGDLRVDFTFAKRP